MTNSATKAILPLLLALLVLCQLSGCATSPMGRNQLIMMPDGQINQMGLAAFQDIKRKNRTNSNPKTNRYVQCVAQAVTAVVGGRWEVVVFDDDTPNAFALPGRKIGVHTGLLQVAENQHQLAAVLAHEVGHVISRHSNERLSQKMAVNTGLQLSSIAISSGTAGSQAALGLLGLGAQYGILLPYSRTHESEADLIGLDIMAKAGFDPQQSIALWINMSRASDGRSSSEFLSTHPSHSTRISDLKAHMKDALVLRQRANAKGRNPNCKR